MTLSFSKLGLAEPILKALAEKYASPTPIQAKAIPAVLEGRDLFGIAQTGTGKTAAFALPIIQRLFANKRAPLRKGCHALVLAPTRELATQIADSFRTYGRFTGLTVTTVFGGVAASPQIRALSRGVDVVVATPGRLLDHIGAGHCDLSGTSILVLDEADQMLDLGFVKPIRTIVARTSHRRQSLFFSATLPKEIEVLAGEILRSPLDVRVSPVASTVEQVGQSVIHVERSRKPGLLAALLADNRMARTLVFTRTKRGADSVTKHLTKCGLSARAIHGNKSQSQREQALDSFRASEIQVLVATDIAARGIDIPEVSHVVNYELPEIPESYVHRIGRTARAGRSGEAISLCDPSERKLLRDIERLTKKTIASQPIEAGTVLDSRTTAGRNDGAETRRTQGSSQRTASGQANGRPAADWRRPRGGGAAHGEVDNRANGGAVRRDGNRPRHNHNDVAGRGVIPLEDGTHSSRRRAGMTPGDGDQRATKDALQQDGRGPRRRRNVQRKRRPLRETA
jgi:ATP-dependent RNA helicase RhlE